MIFILYIVTFLYFSLAIYVYFARRNPINLSFSSVLVGIALWSLSNALFLVAPNQSQMFFWAFISYPFGSFLVASFFIFSVLVTETRIKQRTRFLVFALSFTSFLLPFIPNYIIRDIDFNNKSIINGPGLPILFSIFLFFLTMGTLILVKGIRNSHNTKRIQLIYITVGGLTAIVSGTLTNVVLPLVNNYSLIAIGPTFSLILLSVVSYTIVKYQLFDIRFLIGKVTYYSLQALTLYITFFGIAYVYHLTLGSVFAPAAFVIGVPVAYLYFLFYVKFNEYIRNYTDTRLINPGYNPLEVTDRFSKDVSTELKLKAISSKGLDVIAKTIRPEKQALIVIPEEANGDNGWTYFNFKDQKKHNPKDFKIILDVWEPKDPKPLLIDDFEYEKETRFKTTPHILDELTSIMKAKKIKVIIPITANDSISGMLLLGEKEADTPYTMQDLKFMSSFVSNLGLAISRALLYEEIQDFNIELQKRIEKATGELKEKNKSLEEAITKLEEIRRQERDMLDVMGHELRTPISIVRNALLVLHKKYNKNDGIIDKEILGKYLDMAVESVRREMTLIETMLSATKVEGNRIQLKMTKVDLVDVAGDAIEALQHDAAQKDVPINFKPNVEHLYVYSDRVRVQEIMDNFLSNAIKYTPSGHIDIKLSQSKTSGQVDVVDTGVGISKQDIEQLGKKFFRAQPHYTARDNARPSGTGLGLYVTFELINVLGGKRHIESEIGKGSSFGFSLPLHTDQKDKEIDQTFMTDPSLAKNTIDSEF
ncbi:MAG: ATP-binding protein [Candidatus Dojkabacteria bacterium]